MAIRTQRLKHDLKVRAKEEESEAITDWALALVTARVLDQVPTETSAADLDRPVVAVREVPRVQAVRLRRLKLSSERGY